MEATVERAIVRWRFGVFVAAGVLLVLATAVVAAVYFERIHPFRVTVLVVDDTAVRMDYFLKRVAMTDNADPLAVLQALTYEQIIKREAPNPPYRLDVTDAEVDDFLHQTARGSGPDLSPAEFEEWYRQQLNDTRLTDAEFKDVARTRMLSARMAAYLSAHLPTVAAQVHLYAITATSMEEAKKVKADLDGGQDFRRLAQQDNADAALQANGGDLGWFARSGLPENVGHIAFDELPVGGISDPVLLSNNRLAVLLVAERAGARPIDADALEIARSKALGDWAAAEVSHHHVEYLGFTAGYDSDTDAWVRAEVAKIKSAIR